MSLETWLANGWLVRHTASDQETQDLLDAAARDLTDANKDLSPSWRFNIAYNAALRFCTAVLRVAGYRASRDQKHYRITGRSAVVGRNRDLVGWTPPSERSQPHHASLTLRDVVAATAISSAGRRRVRARSPTDPRKLGYGVRT